MCPASSAPHRMSQLLRERLWDQLSQEHSELLPRSWRRASLGPPRPSGLPSPYQAGHLRRGEGPAGGEGSLERFLTLGGASEHPGVETRTGSYFVQAVTADAFFPKPGHCHGQDKPSVGPPVRHTVCFSEQNLLQVPCFLPPSLLVPSYLSCGSFAPQQTRSSLGRMPPLHRSRQARDQGLCRFGCWHAVAV